MKTIFYTYKNGEENAKHLVLVSCVNADIRNIPLEGTPVTCIHSAVCSFCCINDTLVT